MATEVKAIFPRIGLFQKPDLLLRKHHSQFITKALQSALTRARRNTPVGATALLKGTIATDIIKGVQAESMMGKVTWAQPYAAAVDRGTRPHFPPIRPLLRWARRVLGNMRAAYAVQQAIGKRGTPAKNYLEKTRMEVDPIVRKLYRDQIGRYLRDLL